MDDIALPITETEVESRVSRIPSGVWAGRWQMPGWAVAVAAAVLVATFVGGITWLLAGLDGSGPPTEEPLPVSPTDTIESSTDISTPDVHEQDGIWIHHSGGALMSVSPPMIPPVPGIYEVTVHGYQSGEQGGMWVTSCPGARGRVDPNTWEANQFDIAEVCATPDDQPMATGDFIDGAFQTTVVVRVDESAINDGGIVITAGHIWVPVAGNVLLRIADTPSTAWEKAQNDLNLRRLVSVISYWPPFVQNFNTTYETLTSCSEAHASAQASQNGYLSALEQWDDTQRDKPGYEYDTAVANLLASNQWLLDHTCPGRYDFISIG